MALAERALGRFAHRREGFGQKIVQGLAIAQPLLEGGRHGQQLGVGFLFEFGLERVDLGHGGQLGLDLAFVDRAEKARQHVQRTLDEIVETEHQFLMLPREERAETLEGAKPKGNSRAFWPFKAGGEIRTSPPCQFA